MNQVDANCYHVESTNAAAGGMAQGREESQLGKERPKVQVGPRTRHVEEAFGLREPHGHQLPPASHHCLYISCTFQKKVSMDSVSSRLLTVFCLFVFWFSSASVQQLPTQGVHCPSQHHLFPDSAWPLGSSPPGRLCLHPALC